MNYEQARQVVLEASVGNAAVAELLKKAGEVFCADNGKYSHVCYQNDRFFVAVMCGLEERRLRFYAAQALNNGIIGYWEWCTHAGWHMHVALNKLGIPYDMMPQIKRDTSSFEYSRLPHALCLRLSEKFQLPWKVANHAYEPHAQDEQLKKDILDWWEGEGMSNKEFVLF